jgi:hypothetical protein
LDKDPELKDLMEKHQQLGERVDELSKRAYLTTEESLEKKKLQKDE